MLLIVDYNPLIILVHQYLVNQDRIEIVLVNNEPMFFNERGGPYFPTLKLLHKFPSMMQCMQVDKGAIKFVLSGANIMCPGFTSPGTHVVSCRF